MKRNRHITLIIIILILITTLGGCNPATDVVSISPSQPSLTSPVATIDIATPTATAAIVDENTPVATSTAKPIITSTLVTTATSLVVSDHTKSRICTTTPQVFDVAKTLGIRNYAHLSFQGEDTILFDGWSPRPAPQQVIVPNATPQATVEIGPGDGFSSARILFQAGQIDLESGLILSRTLNMAPLLSNLLDILGQGQHPDEQWPIAQISDRLDILGQSPDGQWQLIQISDWDRDKVGIWLISQTEMLHLIPYVPPSSTWEWADDNSLLWYVHSTPEFGADSIVVHLEHPPLVNRSLDDIENPLDATYYRLAFSPVAKTILSTSEPTESGLNIDPNQLFVIDANNTDLQNTQIIPNIVMAVWNQATQSYIIMVETSHGRDFIDLDGTMLVQVPQVIPPLVFALSPSGQRLAVGYGAVDGIWVYECSEVG